MGNWRSTVAIMAMSAGCAMPVTAEPGRTTWTTYLYQGPGTRYAVIDELQQLTPIEVRSCAEGWCAVVTGGRPGYLRADVVTRSDPAAPEAGVLPQPAASLTATPKGPCLEALQTGGNGGTMPTVFCQK